MQNLNQFKKRLSVGVKVNFYAESVTIYKNNPQKVKVEQWGEENCEVGKTQKNAFARRTSKGTLSWMYYGSAKNWSFPDGNTAVYTETNKYEDQYENTLTLTYKFI